VPFDHVDPGSPAAAAGLRPGDVIVGGGWTSRQVPGSLDRAIALARDAGQVTVRIRRGTRHQELAVTITGQRPDLKQ
jgi:serine protease Do